MNGIASKINVIIVITTMLLSWMNPAYAVQKQLFDKVKEKYVVPDFSLKDEEGKTYKLSDYRGKVVVLNFWATWCSPCRREMPSMERAYKKWAKEGIELVAVNIGDDADKIFAFTGEYDISFTILMDPSSSLYQKYTIPGLPTTYIIDPEGYMVYRVLGGRVWDDPKIAEQIRLLKKPQN